MRDACGINGANETEYPKAEQAKGNDIHALLDPASSRNTALYHVNG